MLKSFSSFSVLLCLIFFSLLPGCGRQSAEKEKRTVTTTIAPLAYLMKGVAGDRMEVQTFIPRGASPETYEPAPSALSDLHHSLAYVEVGCLGFEQSWSRRLSEEYSHLVFCSLDTGLQLAGSADHPDPHIWLSPRNMEVMADQVYHLLCHIDRVNTEYYRENHLLLQERISMVEDSVRTLLAPCGRIPFMVFHPTLTYFARDYGLNQIVIEEEGKEPSARRLKALVEEARRSGVKVVLVQKEFDTRSAQMVAEAVGAAVEVIDPLSEDWDREMIRIASVLRKYAAHS